MKEQVNSGTAAACRITPQCTAAPPDVELRTMNWRIMAVCLEAEWMWQPFLFFLLHLLLFCICWFLFPMPQCWPTFPENVYISTPLWQTTLPLAPPRCPVQLCALKIVHRSAIGSRNEMMLHVMTTTQDWKHLFHSVDFFPPSGYSNDREWQNMCPSTSWKPECNYIVAGA